MSTKFNNGDVVTFRHEHLKIQVYGVVYTDQFGCGVYFGNIDTYSYGECTIQYAMRGGLRAADASDPKVCLTIEWLRARSTRFAELINVSTPTTENTKDEIDFYPMADEDVIYPYPQDVVEREHEQEQEAQSFDDFFNNMIKELGHGNSKSA